MQKKSLAVGGGLLGLLGLGAAALVVLAVLLLVAVPFLFRGRAIAWVEAELDRQLGATVRFEDASVSVWEHFPDLTVGLTGLEVTGEGPFQGVKLATMDELSVTLDLMSVASGGTVTISHLALRHPAFALLTDEEGRSNWDITGGGSADAPADDAAAGGSYALALKDYAIEDLELYYDDVKAGRRVVVKDLDHGGTASVSSDRMAVETRTDIAALSVFDGDTALLRDVKVGWDLDADVARPGGLLTLKDNRLSLNELVLTATGTVDPSGARPVVDLKFEAAETSFKSLLSLVPAVYGAGFDQMVSQGTLALGGHVAGEVDTSGATVPALGMDLTVTGGSFKYPDLPVGVDAVDLDVHVEHPGGDLDAAVVDVRRFSMSVDGQPLSGNATLKHTTTDPEIDAAMKGSVDLGRLAQALPPSDGVTYAGTVDLDVEVAGRSSAFQAQDVAQTKARGTVTVREVVYTDPATAAVPVVVKSMTMTLDPARIEVSDLSLALGKSDLSGHASLDNLLAYWLAGDTLVGRAQLRSTKLNLDAITGATADEEEAPPVEGESSIYVVPENLDMEVGLDLAHVRYGGRTYEDVNGKVAARDGTLRMDQLGMKLFGAGVTLDGVYAAKDDQGADVEVTLDVRELGLESAMAAFHTLRRIAPVAEEAKGKVNTKMSAKMRLGPDLTPELSSLFSDGDVTLLGVVLQPELMAEVGRKIKNGNVDRLDLDETGLKYKIDNGRTRIEPTSVRLGKTKATLRGSAGTLDQTLDFAIDFQLPIDQIGAKDLLGGITAKDVPVVVKIGGTFTDPKVTVDLGEALGAVVDAGIDAALSQAQARADALLAQAKVAADALRAEGLAKADELRKLAKKEVKKLVAQASDPISKKLAEEAGKKIEDEADKAAKKVERESGKAADALFAEAKSKADALLAEAGATAKAKSP